MQAADELRQQTGVRVEIFAVDLARHDICDKVEDYLQAQGLYCQHLVNNAGVGLAAAFKDHKEEELLAMLDLNIRTLTALSRRFLPPMLARNEGGILNVASLGGLIAGPYQGAYYASKAYVLSLTQALSWEMWGTKVRISALAPGPVKTGFHARMGAKNAPYQRFGVGIDAQHAARMGYSGFMCGKGLIIPGVISQLNAVAMKFIPHDLMLPILGWFLRARLKGREDVRDK